MAGNKHASALSLDNEEMAAFAKGRRAQTSPLELLKTTLDSAAMRPDVRPSEQGRGGPVAPPSRTDDRPEAQPPAEAPQRVLAPVDVRQQDQPVKARSPEQDQNNRPPEPPQSGSSEIEDDEMSYSVSRGSDDGVNRGGRPRHGAERKVERTISMDKSLDKMLLNLAIIESVRLGRRVSSAEVAVHLMQYGLSHMKDNQVLPGDDGLGLMITSSAPKTVSLPKLGGEVQ